MINNVQEDIARNIRRAREQKDLSQGDLARGLNVDRSYISSLESGKRNPSVKTLSKIAAVLGITVEHLINPEGQAVNFDFMSSFKYFDDGDDWMLAEEIPDIDFFFSHMWQSCFVDTMDPPAGQAYKKVLSIYNGWHLKFYFGEQDSKSVGDTIVKKFITQSGFINEVNTNVVHHADLLTAFSDTVPETRLDRLSNQELFNYYIQHRQTHYDYYRWAWIPVAADMFHNNFTDRIKKYLEFNLGVDSEKVNEYFITLTQPQDKSLIQQEREEFLKIGLEIQKDDYHRALFEDLYVLFEEQEVIPSKLRPHTEQYERGLEDKVEKIRSEIKPEIYEKIQEHYQKYFYVKFMFVGKEGVHSFDHYVKEFVKLVGRKSDIQGLLDNEEQKYAAGVKKQKDLVKEIGLSEDWQAIFKGFGDFMVTKVYRRYAQIYALYRIRPVLEEIAERLDLSLQELTFMVPDEVENALMNGVIDRKEMRKRSEFCVFYIEDGKEKVFTGYQAELLANQTKQEDIEGVQEFEGQTGCVGKARGIVKIITRPSEMHKMNKGDILVSIATDPDIVPAMEKAAAFVTEQGGVTSHAAIVAREMNKPCVIGTKIATRVLQDGDEVEVDASRGIVRILNKVAN